MKWSVRKGKPGDMVRVHANSYFDHYGVYVSDEEVIQFGFNPALGEPVPDKEVTVVATDMTTFRNGAFPEFADMSFKEKCTRKSPDKAISVARSRIGEGGYNVVHNNCEHFAYECIFGYKYSSQEQKVREMVKLKAMGKLD